MQNNTFIKLLLSPISLLYGIGVGIKNLLYKYDVLKGVEFSLPVISVGNLTVGGTGKTPHIEYLIVLLKDYLNVATLSRGYKRKTEGFGYAENFSTAEEVGDEPLQFKLKFPNVTVAVGEARMFAIPQIVGDFPDTQVILLDDAFQHRSVIPSLNILLTTFDNPFTKDHLLPSGRLREWRSGYERADVIIVTKCPNDITSAQKSQYLKDINPKPNQKVFFSYYKYGNPYYLFDPEYQIELEDTIDASLICALANSKYLVDYLENTIQSTQILEFSDHHYFSEKELDNLRIHFEGIQSERKIILTTEKDAMRLLLHHEYLKQHQLPIFVLPIDVAFHFEEGEQFDAYIKDFLLNFKV